MTRDSARRHHVPLIDLAQLLPKSVRLFYDDDHLSELGAGQLADLLAIALRDHAVVRERLQLAVPADSGPR